MSGGLKENMREYGGHASTINTVSASNSFRHNSVQSELKPTTRCDDIEHHNAVVSIICHKHELPLLRTQCGPTYTPIYA